MLTARTVAEAAHEVGVTERTGYKYLANPDVKQAIAQALDVVLAQATRQAVAAVIGSLDTLVEIHTDRDNPAGARVSAARAIVPLGLRLREALDLAERVTELENRLAGVNYESANKG
jgi:hypothetical protein